MRFPQHWRLVTCSDKSGCWYHRDLKGYSTPKFTFCCFSLTPMSFQIHKSFIIFHAYESLFFFFFLYKKYSRRFITVRLDHWWKIEYPSDAFHTFLDLDNVIYLAVNGTVTSLPGFIQNILNCVLKSNEAFTDLERHGGKWKTTTFSFWGGVSL